MDSSQLLDFFKFCNERLVSLNEYQIARALISHIGDIESVTQEDIAQQANISVASVSRFIHRAGFASFQDFKHKIEIFNHDVRMHRILDHALRFMRYSVKDMTAELYQDARTHLQETYENLDLEKIKQFVSRLKRSRQIVILGDDHELQDFYTFQIDCLVNGISTYMVSIWEAENVMASILNEQDTLLYLELYERWRSDKVVEEMIKAKKKGVCIVAVAQEVNSLKDIAEITLAYGKKHSVNDGYYSLPLLSRLFSELIYHSF